MKLIDLNNDDLLIALFNLTKTYYCCGGHGKAARNKAWMENVIEEMEKRGVIVPSIDERLEKGIFNGVYSC